jgi:cyclopropane fatty-acyl-phospholipid synthase-like methyltransferase
MDTSDEIYQQYKAWTDEILFSLKKDSSVLDLGCGCGLPSTKLLSKTFNVIGVDISPVQIRRAKNLVPNATFVCGDI